MSLAPAETTLVQIHLRELRALREGVLIDLNRNENKAVLRGTAEPLEAVRQELEGLLVEAEESAVQLTLNGAQVGRNATDQDPAPGSISGCTPRRLQDS